MTLLCRIVGESLCGSPLQTSFPSRGEPNAQLQPHLCAAVEPKAEGPPLLPLHHSILLLENCKLISLSCSGWWTKRPECYYVS